MASTTYDQGGFAAARDEAPRERSLGEHAFIWVAWALAAAFWGATLTTLFGIVESIAQGAPATRGGMDFGGLAFLLMDVVGGVIVLGAALAYASWMYARRNRRLDPVGEAATASLYDAVERQGGEDLTSRSPDQGRSDRGA